MATSVLYPIDIFGAEPITYPLTTPAFGFDSCRPAKCASLVATGRQSTIRYTHSLAGQLQLQGYVFPHVQVTDLHWTPTTTFQLHDPTPFKTISINFVLKGQMDCQIQGLPKALPMRAQTHNFIHTPEVGHLNQLTAGQDLQMLLVDVNTDFFLASIGQDDAWAEQIADDLLHERPFAGVAGAPSITPQMRCLIQSIQQCNAEGPMRNLLIQSRVLELMALQIEQFRSPAPVTDVMSPEDADKLHQLKTYLDSHFLLDHSLAQLSRYCGLNEFKVKKGFKKLFHTTVFEYLRRRRMDYGCQLLRNHTLLIEEIADQLGYEHAHHFSVAFRKYTGLLPSQYQQGK